MRSIIITSGPATRMREVESGQLVQMNIYGGSKLASFQQRARGLREAAREGSTVLQIRFCSLSNISKQQLRVLAQTLQQYSMQGSSVLGGSFSNGDNVKVPFQFRRETESQHLDLTRQFFFENRPIYLHITSTRVIRLVKQNMLAFSSIEINNLLPAPVYSVSQVRFKFRSQIQLLPQIRCLITLRVEFSIISVASNITKNIIRKAVNIYQENYWTKNGNLGAPALTGYFCEDFPSRTTKNPLLLRNDEIRPNTRPEVP